MSSYGKLKLGILYLPGLPWIRHCCPHIQLGCNQKRSRCVVKFLICMEWIIKLINWFFWTLLFFNKKLWDSDNSVTHFSKVLYSKDMQSPQILMDASVICFSLAESHCRILDGCDLQWGPLTPLPLQKNLIFLSIKELNYCNQWMAIFNSNTCSSAKQIRFLEHSFSYRSQGWNIRPEKWKSFPCFMHASDPAFTSFYAEEQRKKTSVSRPHLFCYKTFFFRKASF